MSFFKTDKKEEPCTCGSHCDCGTAEIKKASEACCASAEKGICCIKVLGSGCRNCHALFENTQQAVKELGLAIEVEYITDMAKVMAFGAMSMPVLVVNDKIASQGRVLKPAEIKNLLEKY